MCPSVSPRIGLISPYGNNLGDGTIQEAIIQNISKRVPKGRFYGIYLLPAAAGERHQIPVVPLAGFSRPPGYSVVRQRYYPGKAVGTERVQEQSLILAPASPAGYFSRQITCVKDLLKKIPLVRSSLRLVYQAIVLVASEASHLVESHKALRQTDLLIIAGGGQIADDWGGPWGHPYNLFKWALLARLNRIPLWFLSVGSNPTRSSLSKLFFRLALRQATYRSHRGRRSKAYLARFFGFLIKDPVLPDLAFSYLVPNQCEATGSGGRVRSGKVVGICPIAYCHPDLWPIKDKGMYDRYVTELAEFVKSLLRRNHHIVFFRTASADKCVISDIRERLGSTRDRELEEPFTGTLESLFNTLSRVDVVVASRLHGVILSHVMEKPVLAIAFEEKVTSHMEETNQIRHCVDIRTFTATSLMDNLLELERSEVLIRTHLKKMKETFSKLLDQQYDRLAHQLGVQTT